MDNCLFCKLQEQKPDNLILENEYFYALYDTAPVSPGHALLIPKKHMMSFFELGANGMAHMYNFLIQVKDKVYEKHKPAGYNIGINEGRYAGRTIDHLHIHLIPRYPGDIENPVGGVRNIFGIHIPPASSGNK